MHEIASQAPLTVEFLHTVRSGCSLHISYLSSSGSESVLPGEPLVLGVTVVSDVTVVDPSELFVVVVVVVVDDPSEFCCVTL